MKTIIDKQELFIIRELAHKDKSRENSSNVLGQFWQILDPFINMLVLVLLFSTIFKNNTFVNYPMYVTTGTMLFSLFNIGTKNCMNALVSNKSFLIKTQINKTVFVKERIYVAFINFIYMFLIYIGMMFFFRIPFRWTMLLLIPDICLFLIFIYGFGKILSVINVLFADISYFYDIFTLMIFYGSALFYDPSKLEYKVQLLLSFNPIYLVIVIARLAILDGIVASWTVWLKLILYSCISIYIGNYFFEIGTKNIVAKL